MAAFTAMIEVQEAMRAAWTGDATLSGMVTGVFDGVPEGQPLPYIVRLSTVETAWALTSGYQQGRATVITWEVFWEGEGADAGIAIIGEMNRLVENQVLTLASFDNKQTLCEQVSLLPVELDTGVFINHASVRYVTNNYPQ